MLSINRKTERISGTFLLSTLLIPLALLLGGCGTAVLRSPVPKDFVDHVVVDGTTGPVRAWGDCIDPVVTQEWLKEIRQHPSTTNPSDESGPGFGALVISGGGDCGAYGAGLLCAWTQRGDRPRFRMVTGVSTGALIAPFAFLGSKYDKELRESYTTIHPDDILKPRFILELLRWDSIADSTPLHKLLQRTISDAMIDDVAIEHAKGRRLLVQTVNLDAQRPVMWDMGAIAISNHPDRKKLFRQVLLASASIPGVFPPQYIKVKVNGKRYDEMHVDGGTVSQMLLSTLPVNLKTISEASTQSTQHRPRLYIIRNGYVSPEWKHITPKLFPIGGRAISTMIKAQAEADLELIYYQVMETGGDYHLAFLPADYVREHEEEFDSTEMNRMFKLGYDTMLAGTAWHSEPPRMLQKEAESVK